MELKGLTPVDSVYEAGGFQLAGSMSDLAWSVGLPLILALAGLAYVVHACVEKGSMREAAVHVFYLLLMAWLLGPTEVHVASGASGLREWLQMEGKRETDVRVPRLVAYVAAGADVLQRGAIEKVNREFLTHPFKSARLQALLSAAEIQDSQLRVDLVQFAVSCWRPAIALDRRPDSALISLHPLHPGSFSYREGGAVVLSRRDVPHRTYIVQCEDARAELLKRVEEHFRVDNFLRKVGQLLVGSSGPTASAVLSRDVVLKAMLAGQRPSDRPGETASIVRAALPELQNRGTPPDKSDLVGTMKHSAGIALDWALDRSQDADNRMTSRQKKYLIVLQGPYLYGLALMIVAGLFPVVGMFAILPGRWRALVHWGKAFLSIKLWPVCWAILTKFEARAASVDAWQEVSTADLATVIASMYVVTPALCFAIVALATSVSALPFHQAASSPAGVGPAVMVARAGGRIMRG